MKRADIDRLLDKTPESELPKIGSFIGYVISESQKDPLEKILEAAPYDDEELTSEDIEDIKTSLEQIQRGEVFSREEIIREFDLD